MFNAAPMMRLHAIVLNKDERAVLESLGKLGAIQLTHTQYGDELGTKDRTAELSRYDRLSARIEEIGRLLEVSFSSAPEVSRAETLHIDRIEDRLRTMEAEVGEVMDLRRAYRQKQRELAVVCEQAEDYRNTDLPLDGPDNFSFLHFVTGSIPEQNLAALQKELGKNISLVTMIPKKGRQSLIAMTTREASRALGEVLQKAGFQREVLPVARGATVDSLCAEKDSEQKRLDEELSRLNVRIRGLTEEFSSELIQMSSLIDSELGMARAQEVLGRTDATSVIAGWVPAARSQEIIEGLNEVTGKRCSIEMTAPGSPTDGDVPTLLVHNRFLRPFGMLMSSYGVPNYRELEPTLFVAISYILMFGFMFGDAGQGAILAGLGVFALLKGKTEDLRDVGVLLCSCGCSSIIFGIIYGSVFGLEFFKHYALWHDPLEGDPMGLMYSAIIVGIVMISLGLILNVINRFKRKDFIGGFLDKFGLAGVVFYWGVLAIIIFKGFFDKAGLMGPAMIVFIALPALCWITKEPIEYFVHRARQKRAGKAGGHTGGLSEAIMESCVGAFEAFLSYLANTISFVRLGAYAMSHAALLVAAFMLAEQVKHLTGGSVWNVIVIILGNLVAIVLEGIIASVQALRLEYYEFFGKFYSGNGQAFEPFRLGKRKAN
ncbi:MAG: V-type ATP synthase subunit I [Syntrophorhabdaceae bacterium]